MLRWLHGTELLTQNKVGLGLVGLAATLQKSFKLLYLLLCRFLPTAVINFRRSGGVGLLWLNCP